MTESVWLELTRRLQIAEDPDRSYVARATEPVIQAAEREMGIALPESYKHWCQVFGAGELAGFFRISSPMSESSPFEIKQFNAQWRGSPEDDLWATQIEKAFLSSLVWFAETIGGESFAWQTKEPSNPVDHEYRIYYIPRHGAPEMCAASFVEWVTDRCLTPNEQRKWSPEWYFSRFCSE